MPYKNFKRHDIAEILLKVALNTIKQINKNFKNKGFKALVKLRKTFFFWEPMCFEVGTLLYIFYLPYLFLFIWNLEILLTAFLV